MGHKVETCGASIGRLDRLIINVHRTCRNCGAPGYWHNVPGVNPGCYAPDKVTQLGNDPVGPVCPQCGANRDDVELHGEVWSREFRPGIWPVLKAAVWSGVKSLKRRRRR